MDRGALWRQQQTVERRIEELESDRPVHELLQPAIALTRERRAIELRERYREREHLREKLATPQRVEILRGGENSFLVVVDGVVTQNLCWEEMLAQVVCVTAPGYFVPGEPRWKETGLVTWQGDRMRETVREQLASEPLPVVRARTFGDPEGDTWYRVVCPSCKADDTFSIVQAFDGPPAACARCGDRNAKVERVDAPTSGGPNG